MAASKQDPLSQFMALLRMIEGDTKAEKPRRRKRPAARQILQLKISLKYIRPSIWRRVVAADNMTLGELHDVIQSVMGWHGGHLHAFRKPARGFGPPAMIFDNEQGNEQTTFLGEVFVKKGGKLVYEYDFGDGWEHDVMVEKLLPFDAAIALPACLAGERACPPEDCGGVPGYYDLLEALKDSANPRHTELMEWAGDYDPEAFDLRRVQRRIPRR